jgi:hypothetical protein
VLKLFKSIIKAVPFLGNAARRIYPWLRREAGSKNNFAGTANYWQTRYSSGGNSGAGSYGRLAVFKADILNSFIAENNIADVIEFGCGDGNQLSLARYPTYLGFDISDAAVDTCRSRFARDSTKQFLHLRQYAGQQADLAVSLDVIFHLVEDDVFENYMQLLFAAARRHIAIYSTNTDDNAGYEGTHVRHRCFANWVEQHCPDWFMVRNVPNRYPFTDNPETQSFAEFFFYEKKPGR